MTASAQLRGSRPSRRCALPISSSSAPTCPRARPSATGCCAPPAGARLLRHRHPDHAAAARPRRPRVPRGRAGPRVRPLPVVHRRPDARAAARATSAPAAPCAFFCLVDPEAYRPRGGRPQSDLGYLGTYSHDRQPALEELLLDAGPPPPGRRFAVAGSGYPPDDRLAGQRRPRIEHLPPPATTPRSTPASASRSTSPAPTCARRLVAERPAVRGRRLRGAGHLRRWPGLEEIFMPGEEILLADDARRGARDPRPRSPTASGGRSAAGRASACSRAHRRPAGRQLEAEVAIRRSGTRRRHDAAVARSPAPVAGDGRAGIAELGPWFHDLHLPSGHQTAPDHPLGDFPAFKWEQFAASIPDDLHGARALDIGCNAGYYSFELAARGAEVLAIDVDEHYLRQARWAARLPRSGGPIEFRAWRSTTSPMSTTLRRGPVPRCPLPPSPSAAGARPGRCASAAG